MKMLCLVFTLMYNLIFMSCGSNRDTNFNILNKSLKLQSDPQDQETSSEELPPSDPGSYKLIMFNVGDKIELHSVTNEGGNKRTFIFKMGIKWNKVTVVIKAGESYINAQTDGVKLGTLGGRDVWVYAFFGVASTWASHPDRVYFRCTWGTLGEQGFDFMGFLATGSESFRSGMIEKFNQSYRIDPGSIVLEQ